MKGKTMLLVGTLVVGLVGIVPALAQTPVVEDDLGQVPIAMVDCAMGGPCVGIPGDDTITGSQE